ncbi:MAG: hypothetical protein ABIP15_03535 [Devosia sp.]
MRPSFILCMREDEAHFFAGLLGLRSEEVRWVTSRELGNALDEIVGRARLISFCSDVIIPAATIETLEGECFNFHSGPPERPGYRPTSFAAVRGDTHFGVTFYRLVPEVDAGTIYATRRFVLSPPMTEAQVSELAYLELLKMAREVAPLLADFNADFLPNGDVWQGIPTTRADYHLLLS